MDKCSGVTAIVEYDYAAKESDELDLVKGALIHSIKQMPGGWWEGTLQTNGKTGMFPDNFVRVIDTNDDATVQLRDKAATANRRCKVIFSYTQVNDDELSLAVGDVIEFLGEVEEGWWRGRLKNKVGVFPSNFVVAIEPSPVLASKRPPTINANAALGLAAAVNKPTLVAAAVAAPTTTVSQTTKKLNRLSMHSSKPDLLNAATADVPPEDAPSLPPKPQREYCRVEFPYAPQNEDELELKVGDIIAVISTELPDKGWWKGELRGKIGVFPDNFVKLLAPNQVAPLNDTQPTHRTAKQATTNVASSSTSNATTTTTAAAAAATSTTHISNSSATSTKVFIKKSGSTSSSHSSNRKDSFGSRDSLNDILSETGLTSGNVAAQRKSLENKNFDLTNPPDATTRMGMKKQPNDNKSSTAITSNANTTSALGNSTSTNTNDLRKSIENLDEKSLKTTPPPVLTKKPMVPNKKTTTVTSVAGNLLSGLKQKVKNVESKLTTAASHDAADGIGSSKLSPNGVVPEAGAAGAVVMRRAATIAVEDSDFDRVERASILTDMRANRVKAPKRRPPSAAINVIGESNNNNSIYLNGADTSDDNKLQSSDDNSMGESDQLAKPKPREWEKKKAPWMEELKASQVKKKTSPGIEPIAVGGSSVAERASKLFSEELKSSSTSITSSTSNSTSSAVISSTAQVTSAATTNTTKVQSSTISSSSVMQQSMHAESSTTLSSQNQSLHSKRDASSNDAMSKSVSAALTGQQLDDIRSTRPNSLALRNRSASPSQAQANARNAAHMSLSVKSNANEVINNSHAVSNHNHSNTAKTVHTSSTGNSTTTATSSTTIVNNHHANEMNVKTISVDSTSNNGHAHSSSSSASANSAVRVLELEKRVDKLETIVQSQQRTIDELVRMLREETDRVKLLRGELDKYAQCVTQV